MAILDPALDRDLGGMHLEGHRNQTPFTLRSFCREAISLG